MFFVLEHSKLKLENNYFTQDEKVNFQNEYENENPKYLGLHQELENGTLAFYTHYFIGYRWLNKKTYLHVKPKEHNGKYADYLFMFLKCLKNPIVSKKMNKTYEIFFNERWIKIDKEDDILTPFLVFHFLELVRKISQKGLKKGYVNITKNLTSKIKGKILVNNTTRTNHFKSRYDKTVCSYQDFTANCLENQILKTALLQCSKHLYTINNKYTKHLLMQNLSKFELVDKIEVYENDFSKIKLSAFYKDYKEALQIAKMIFKRFGFSLNSIKNEKNYKIPPFYINMPELFERYVEVKLRERYSNLIDANRDIKGVAFGMRPDFLLKEKQMIIDAKYKYWFENDTNIDFKEDFSQLSLYGREKKIKKIINSDSEIKLVFLYPREAKCLFNLENIQDYQEDKFSQIYKIGIEIPTKKA